MAEPSLRVALLTDNPYRDLPGIVLFAGKLVEAGHTCYLVPTHLEWREVGALAPDLVVLTNIRGPRHELARRLLDAGVRVAVLENEGGVMPDFATYTKMTAPDPALFRRLSCFCTWGPKVAAHALDNGWYEPGQVAVTGAPRFDFYAERWRAAALAASSALAAYHEPLILVNGSFPRANPRFLTPEREIESWQTLGFSREYVVRFQTIEREAMLGMAEVANHLARTFPDVKVVYRPHPFERIETYDALLERRDNLELLKVGTVEGWILRATVIVHRNSTTAIEAGMAGRPALLPTWLPTAETLEACDAVSVKCATPDELDGRVREALQGTWRPSPELRADIDRIVHDWFWRADGASHERVAAALLPHLSSRPTVNLAGCREIHYWGYRPATLTSRSRLSVRARMALGVPVTWSFSRWGHVDPAEAWVRSEKYFDAPRVRELCAAFGSQPGALDVGPAEDGRDYRLPYRYGRSVTMRPASGNR